MHLLIHHASRVRGRMQAASNSPNLEASEEDVALRRPSSPCIANPNPPSPTMWSSSGSGSKKPAQSVCRLPSACWSLHADVMAIRTDCPTATGDGPSRYVDATKPIGGHETVSLTVVAVLVE